MGLNRDALTVFHRPWFSGVPKNAVKASEVLTLTDVAIATENVTIGDEIYEFITNGGDASTPTNIEVELAATPSTDDSVTKLALAINTHSTLVSAVASTPNDTVTITSKLVGTEGNDIAISETLTNGSFADGATELSGGQYATPCRATNALIKIDGTKYYTEKPVDKFTEGAWKTVGLT